ncbi:MAG TPA: CrcB family protein [Egibacteraceae bacterium]|nr:CrcB family protein [Egibacteraceae bacterium]
MSGLADRGWMRRLAVAAGGAIGGGLRGALILLVPPVGGFPVATLGANLAGALLLGVALRRLVPLGRPWLTSLVTTGLLGALTTFATMALEVVLLAPDDPQVAAAYLAVSLVAGPLAARLGLRLGRAG